jgi:hypothetical protein
MLFVSNSKHLWEQYIMLMVEGNSLRAIASKSRRTLSESHRISLVKSPYQPLSITEPKLLYSTDIRLIYLFYVSYSLQAENILYF